MEQLILYTGISLMLIGLWPILRTGHIIRIIVGIAVFEVGLHITLIRAGFIEGATAPILKSSQSAHNIQMVDPVPQAMVLTAIVIGLGITALLLVVAGRVYKKNGSYDLKKCGEFKW